MGDVSGSLSDIGALAPLTPFATRAKCAALYHETVYAAVGARIEALNFQGVVKKILTFSEAEGVPVVLDVWSDFLCVATSVGVVKLWNIKRAEPVAVVPGRLFEEYVWFVVCWLLFVCFVVFVVFVPY